MIETRIAHQLNRIAGAAAAAVPSNSTITNIVEFAIIALFQFQIVVIAHTNCLPKFCFRCFERDGKKNEPEITSGQLCVFRCSLCMNVISALAEQFLYKIFRTCSAVQCSVFIHSIALNLNRTKKKKKMTRSRFTCTLHAFSK